MADQPNRPLPTGEGTGLSIDNWRNIIAGINRRGLLDLPGNTLESLQRQLGSMTSLPPQSFNKPSETPENAKGSRLPALIPLQSTLQSRVDRGPMYAKTEVDPNYWGSPSPRKNEVDSSEDVVDPEVKKRFEASIDTFADIFEDFAKNFEYNLVDGGGSKKPPPPDKDVISSPGSDDEGERLLEVLANHANKVKNPPTLKTPPSWNPVAEDILGRHGGTVDRFSSLRGMGEDISKTGTHDVRMFTRRGVNFLSGMGEAFAGGSIGAPLSLGMYTIKKLLENPKAFGPVGALDHAGKMIGSSRYGEIGYHAFSAVQSATSVVGGLSGMMPGNAVNMSVNALAGVGAITMKAIDALQRWTEGLHSSNMELAKFSASMAGVQARQQFRDIVLGIERGERRAPFAEMLAESKNKLEKETSRPEDIWKNIKDWVTSGFNRDATTLAEAGNNIIDALKETSDTLKKAIEFFENSKLDDDKTPGFLADVMTEYWDTNWGAPPRFND